MKRILLMIIAMILLTGYDGKLNIFPKDRNNLPEYFPQYSPRYYPQRFQSFQRGWQPPKYDRWGDTKSDRRKEEARRDRNRFRLSPHSYPSPSRGFHSSKPSWR